MLLELKMKLLNNIIFYTKYNTYIQVFLKDIKRIHQENHPLTLFL